MGFKGQEEEKKYHSIAEDENIPSVFNDSTLVSTDEQRIFMN
jgi:hypothetical protein